MNFSTIQDCFEYLRTSGPYNEAISDAWAASRQSVQCLESFFDSQLFMGEDYVFDNEEDKAYRDTLLRVEAILVENGLIYCEERG
jgi:hypothetical protein